MRYGLLGPLHVVDDAGAPVTIASPKRRALLAVLLLHANEPVSIAGLTDALWGSDPPAAAISSLRAQVSRLRREVGPVIATAPNGYLMQVEKGELDVATFLERLEAGRHEIQGGDYARASVTLRSALELWRGPALADFADEPFAQAQQRRLDELRLEALGSRIEADLLLGRADRLVAELEAVVAERPLQERAWGQLMRALYLSGRQADALAAYRRLRSTLVEELGIDPSTDLQELEARILQQDPALGAPATQPGQAPIQLPVPLTGLTGRAEELRRAMELVRAHRLVTLTGPGGVGKTRLAIAVAQAVLDDHPDGVLFVDLSGIRDASLVPAAVGEVTGGGERPAAVIGGREMLLLLDNFEQVLPAAPWVLDLLARCSGLRILVTSRAPLQVRGEHLLEVPPLSADSAADLFEERARAALMSQTPASVVRDIVARLDNLPLAIELAATRVRVLSPEALRDGLSRRLELLAAPDRGMPERHRTLRETIAWSYELLTDGGRDTLRRLSVFPGSFDLRAACAVGEATLDDIAELVDHSLLRRFGTRYQMLDTIREFAIGEADTQGATDVARIRHLDHYLTVATATGRATTEGGLSASNAWQVMCRTERDNLRLAFDTAVASERWEQVAQLFHAVGMYWLLVGAMDEGERWGARALEAATHLGPGAEMGALMLLSEFPRQRGDHARAIRLKERAAELARSEGMDPGIVATILADTADSYGALGEFEHAHALLDEALTCRRRSTADDPLGMAHTLSGYVELALHERQPDDALRHYRALAAAEEAARDAMHPDWLAEAGSLRARVLQLAGRTDQAREIFRQNLRESAAIDFRLPMVNALDGLAEMLALERPDAAARLVGMADRVRAESGFRVWDPEQRARTMAIIAARLGPGECARQQTAGHAVPLSGMAEAALALSARAGGEPPRSAEAPGAG